MPEAKEIVRRYEELRNQRGTWEAHWQEIADYGIGRRDFSTQSTTKGRKRQHQIFDNTFMQAGEMLAAGLHSLLSNPATRWFRLKLENDLLMEIEDVAIWVQMAEKRLYDAFNRPEAGFSAAMHEAYIDIVHFGTGGTFIDDGLEGVIFMSVPLSGLYLGENPHGRLDTYMWLRRMSAKQIVEEYGKGAMEKADRSISAKRYEEEYDVLRAVMPRYDPQVRSLGPQRLPWASFHVALEEPKLLREGGYHERPFAVSRWDKDAGEIYGRGPGVKALVSQRVANEQQKTLLKAGQKRVDPPLIIPGDGVVTALQTQPGGISVAKSAYMQGGKPPIFPLDSGSDMPIGVEMLNLSRQDVRSAFHWELLELIQHVPGTTPPTATHISEIASNQQRVIAPILGRIQEEMLETTVERVFGIEYRAGRLPPIPPILAGQPLRVEYVSPAVRAQRHSDARAIRNLLATAAEYGQFDSVALKMIETEEAMRVIADAEGVPVGVVRSRRDMERLLAAERKLAMQEALGREEMRQAEMIGKAAPALKAIQGGKAA